MEIVMLPVGIAAAVEDDCIQIERSADGTFLLGGTVLCAGEDDVTESVTLISSEPYQSYEAAEAAGLAWADACGVTMLHISRSYGTGEFPDPA